MGLPFISARTKKRDQIIAVDLGERTTKAVCLQRQVNGNSFSLLNFAVVDAPVQKSFAVDTLSDHLKSIFKSLDTKTRSVALAIGVGDSIVRHTEIPPMPMGEMRQILKLNPKGYLQQDLANYIFDCHITPPRNAPNSPDRAANVTPPANQKLKTLVAGAKKQLVADLQTAVTNAGMVAEHIMPGVIGPLNAFELAMPEIFSKELFALVDIGFKHTTISIIQQGELILSRVVSMGGDKLTTGLSESLGVGYAEAEGIKVGMPAEVQPTLETLVMPLGRELRASIDFFEHQQEKHVSQVFVSGGSARSEFILKVLESELMLPCKTWSPLGAIQLTLPPQKMAEVEQLATQLSVAIGAAAATF